MSFITIDATACKRDNLCVSVCPIGCLESGPDGTPRVADNAHCIGCGHCVAVCPHAAITNTHVDAAACLPMPRDLPDAASVRNQLLARRSVRAYKDKPVDKATLAELLDTARRAPTASNSQNVSWVACVDPEKTREVARLTAAWMRSSVGPSYRTKLVDMWDAGQDTILRGAPALVVACCPREYPWGAVDGAIALTYLELAAAAAGLGTCWAGLLTHATKNYTALAAFLGIAPDHVMCGGVMLGYPAFRYQLIPPRKALRVSWL